MLDLLLRDFFDFPLTPPLLFLLWDLAETTLDLASSDAFWLLRFFVALVFCWLTVADWARLPLLASPVIFRFKTTFRESFESFWWYEILSSFLSLFDYFDVTYFLSPDSAKSNFESSASAGAAFSSLFYELKLLLPKFIRFFEMWISLI